MNDYERGWIEALIDGEGSLCVQRVQHGTVSAKLEICNTKKELLERAHTIIGGVISVTIPKNPKWNPLFQLTVSANFLKGFLPQIRLINKERQRLLILDLFVVQKEAGKRYTPEQKARVDGIAVELHALNRRGR